MTTWDDYPYSPYPGFKDPEDWRGLAGSVGEVPASEARRGAQAVNEVFLSHADKHDKYEHPWCAACEKRRNDFESLTEGFEPTLSPAHATSNLRKVADDHGADWDAVRKAYGRLKDLFYSGNGIISEDQYAIAGRDLELPTEVVMAAGYCIKQVDRWEDEQRRADETVTSRAMRYLVLHRSLPLDTYDPAVEVETDHDQYLDRDQLRDLPVPEPLIDGILNRYSYVLLIGRDHTYKTFTALDWALCLATGKQWQGQAVEQARVLYIAGEGAYGLAKRIDAWEYAWGRKVPADRFTVRTSAVNLYRGGPALERLLERLSEGEYDLTVVDTLRRASGGANGNDTDMGLVVDNLERIKRATDTGSVLVIAHTDKGDNDARGFSGIEDDADIVWHAKADDAGNLTLKNTKQKDQAEHHDLQLHMAPALDSLVIEAASAADTVSTESEAALLVTMREMFSQTGATSTELLEATGMAKSTYYRARNKCLSNGLITNSGTKSRPRYELAQSHTGPDDPHVPDLQLSHESHEVPAEPRDSPTSPAPLIGRDVGIGTGRPTGQVAS